jgi:hypothetical protein
MNKNFVIGLLSGGILWLLYKDKLKKKCSCEGEEELLDDETSGGGAMGGSGGMGGSGAKKSYKKSKADTEMPPSAKSVLDKYDKEDICACKDAVKTIANQMKFATEADKKAFLDQEIIKCLETE